MAHSVPPEDEILRLVQGLHDTQRRLEELTGGAVDAVIHPEGQAYLLRDAQNKLRVSEADQRDVASTLSSILSALPANVALINHDGVLIAVNEGWRQFARSNGLHSPEFAMGSNYLNVCDEATGVRSEEADETAAGIRSVLSGALHEFSLEYPCHSSSEQRWFRLMVNRLDDDAHGAAVVMHVDVTDRKFAEEALRESEERFRGAFEQAAVGIAHSSPDGLFVQVNDKLCEIGGYPREVLLGRGFLDFVHPDDGAAIEMARIAMLSGERASYSAETRFFRIDGQPGWANLIITPTRTDAGDTKYFISVVEDITARKRTENALHASERQFSSAFEFAAIGVALVAPNGRWLKVNRALCQMMGYSETELLAMTFQDVTHPDDLESDVERAANLLAGAGDSYQMEKRYIHRLGHQVWALLNVSLVRDHEGRPVHFISQVQDITGQRQAREALRIQAQMLDAERARLVAAQAVANMGSWEIDLGTRRVIWSAETHRIFESGSEQSRMTYRRFMAMVHPGDRSIVAEAYSDSIASRAPCILDHRVLLPDGGIKHIEERWQVFHDEQGTRIIGTAHDITDRKRADARIREQASMLDEATDAILVRDLNERITYWNRSAESLYGWSAEEAVGQSARDLLHSETAVFNDATKLVLSDGAWSGELKKTTRTGDKVTVEARWTLLRDELGSPRSVLSINTDVTERKKLEAQFLRAQRMESIGTLAGGIAHDLNNLLSPIVMGVGVLRRFEQREKILAVINNIEKSAKRGTDLVKQVLSFGKGVEGTRVRVRLGDIVSEVEAIASSTFPKNITLEHDIAPDLRLIVGDPTQLNQVLLNLCVNARDAMPEGGRLTISAQNVEIDEQYASMNPRVSAGPYAVLSVSDEGCGMSTEVMDRVFDPFFTTKETGHGTGLGLSTASGIVQSHGGFVNVYSEVEVGSVFRIYLPAAAVALPGFEEAMKHAELLPRGRGELVLVVDDEASIRGVTSQTLEAFGYRAITAEDGAQAIGQYAMRRDEIALVLTDMMMPVMDGPALIAALRRINPRVKIIAASGLGAHDRSAKASHAGTVHFLAKPFSADAMLTLMKKVLSGGDSGEGSGP